MNRGTTHSLDKPTLESLISNPDFSRTAQNLANHYARIYRNNAMIDPADLLSEALLAATTAYISFDVTRGVTFKTHAFPYMKHAVQTYCNKFCHILTISEKAARDNLGAMTDIGILRIDQHPAGEDGGEFDIPVGSGLDLHYDIEEFFFAGFSELEKNLVRDYLVNDLSIRELSAKYNISKSRIGSIISGLTHRMQERARNYAEND